VCAACPTPRLNQSYELRPPWEQHLRYVPHRVRNGYNTMFGVPMKLGIAKYVLQRKLTINMTTEEESVKVININNESTGDIEDENIDHEPTLDLQLQGNDNTGVTEAHVTMKVETEVQNKKIDPEAISVTPRRDNCGYQQGSERKSVWRGCQGKT